MAFEEEGKKNHLKQKRIKAKRVHEKQKKNEAKANPLILQGYLKTYIKKKKRLFSLPAFASESAVHLNVT